MSRRDPSAFAPVTAVEYALIRERLPEGKRPVFDRLRETGERLGEVTGNKPGYIAAWSRAVRQACNDGLGRYIRVHDLRLTKAHELYRPTNADWRQGPHPEHPTIRTRTRMTTRIRTRGGEMSQLDDIRGRVDDALIHQSLDSEDYAEKAWAVVPDAAHLIADIDRLEVLARNLDRLAPGDQHYAALIRAAIKDDANV